MSSWRVISCRMAEGGWTGSYKSRFAWLCKIRAKIRATGHGPQTMIRPGNGDGREETDRVDSGLIRLRGDGPIRVSGRQLPSCLTLDEKIVLTRLQSGGSTGGSTKIRDVERGGTPWERA